MSKCYKKILSKFNYLFVIKKRKIKKQRNLCEKKIRSSLGEKKKEVRSNN